MIAVDTNILVYAFDKSYPEKSEKYKRIVTEDEKDFISAGLEVENPFKSKK